MSIRERLVDRVKRLGVILDAAGSVAEFDPHENFQRRLTAIEARLQALEQPADAGATAH